MLGIPQSLYHSIIMSIGVKGAFVLAVRGSGQVRYGHEVGSPSGRSVGIGSNPQEHGRAVTYVM